MKALLRSFLLQFFALAGLWAGKEFVALPGESFHSDELVVRLKPGAALSQVNPGLPTQVAMLRKHPRLPVMTVRVPPGLREMISRALARSPLVDYVEPHRRRQVSGLTPSDISFASQWWLTRMQAPDAWSLWPARFPQAGQFGARVRVAILDTGADCTHPDFINSGGTSTNSTNGGQISFALSQAIVPTTVPAPACPWQDDNGHGTHVAGLLAAATNNATGVASLAFSAELMIFKAMDSAGQGSDLDLAEAITAAADNGARIISMSLGGQGYSQMLQDAVDYAWERNALVIAASGNSGSSSLFFPAGANFALGVGATDSADARASFSNYGFGLDVMAPGVSILSTNMGGGYSTKSGTSMATPHASAVAALILAANPGLAAEAVAQRLIMASDPLTTGSVWTVLLGYGRVNAWRSLSGTFPLRTVGGLVGQVVDSDGAPVPNAAVTLSGVAGTTDFNGLFRFVNFPAGPHPFFASAAGHPSRSLNVTVPSGADTHLRLELRADVGTFSGIVMVGGSLPLSGAAIQILQAGRVVAGGTSAADGLYAIQVPAGTYDLRMTAPGQAEQTVTSRTITAGGVATVNFNALTLGRVNGMVRDDASNPIAGAQVTVSDGNVSAGAVTDSTGHYTTIAIPAGVYSVTAFKAPNMQSSVGGVAVANESLVSVDLTLSGESALAGLTLSPTAIGGGAVSAANVVTLSLPAGPGGIQVTLSSSNPAVAEVPAAITVPQGATTSAPFTITTRTVSASTPVTIQATRGATQKSATLTVLAIQVTSLSLSPATLAGGASATTNRLYLNTAAPPGGATVTLTSSNPALVAPPVSVVVPAGTTYSGYFTIPTYPVTANTQVTLTASYAGSTKQAIMTLTPPALSLFSMSPATVAGGRIITGAYVRLNGPAPAGGAVVTLQSSGPAASLPAAVTITAGNTSSATFNIPTTSVTQPTTVVLTATYSGAQKTVNLTLNPTALLSLSAPVSITGSKSFTSTVTLDGPAAPSGFVVVLASSNPAVTPPASLTVAAGATTATFTSTTLAVAAATPVTLSASSGSVSKGVTVQVLPPVLSSLSLAASVTGGKPLPGTVYLTGTAPAGGHVVTLTSSNPAAAVPASVTVSAGASTAAFTITTTHVSSATPAIISATGGGVTKTATVALNPPVLSSMYLAASVTGGKPLTGTVYLTGTAPAGGQVVTLTSSNPAATVPASITVAAGASTTTFTVTTFNVPAPLSTTITASSGGIIKTVNVTVIPPVLSSMYLAASVTGGKPLTGTLYLSGPAPAGGQVVTLASSNPVATVPAGVSVAAGASTATFVLTTTPLNANGSAVITASSGGATRTSTVTILPPVLHAVSLLTSVTGSKTLSGTLTLSGPAPAGGQSVTLSSSHPAAAVPASVTVAAGFSTATFSVTTVPVASPASAIITASSREVVKTALLTVKPPALYSLSLSPVTVKGGNNVSATMTLDGAAPAGGVSIAISASSASASPPANVTIAAGATSATFSIPTTAVASSTPASIAATLAGVVKTALLTINP